MFFLAGVVIGMLLVIACFLKDIRDILRARMPPRSHWTKD